MFHGAFLSLDICEEGVWRLSNMVCRAYDALAHQVIGKGYVCQFTDRVIYMISDQFAAMACLISEMHVTRHVALPRLLGDQEHVAT